LPTCLPAPGSPRTGPGPRGGRSGVSAPGLEPPDIAFATVRDAFSSRQLAVAAGSYGQSKNQNCNPLLAVELWRPL